MYNTVYICIDAYDILGHPGTVRGIPGHTSKSYNSYQSSHKMYRALAEAGHKGSGFTPIIICRMILLPKMEMQGRSSSPKGGRVTAVRAKGRACARKCFGRGEQKTRLYCTLAGLICVTANAASLFHYLE